MKLQRKFISSTRYHSKYNISIFAYRIHSAHFQHFEIPVNAQTSAFPLIQVLKILIRQTNEEKKERKKERLYVKIL